MDLVDHKRFYNVRDEMRLVTLKTWLDIQDSSVIESLGRDTEDSAIQSSTISVS